MNADLLLLGVDGGGTSCRARLCAFRVKCLAKPQPGRQPVPRRRAKLQRGNGRDSRVYPPSRTVIFAAATNRSVSPWRAPVNRPTSPRRRLMRILFAKRSSSPTPTPPASALTADVMAASLWRAPVPSAGRSRRAALSASAVGALQSLTKEVALGSVVRRCGASYGHLMAARF